MFFLDQLLSPKVRVHIVLTGISAENGYTVKNIIQAWGLPGCIRMHTDGMMDIDVEGRQTDVDPKLEELAHNSIVAHGTMHTQSLPYTGSYAYMTVSF